MLTIGGSEARSESAAPNLLVRLGCLHDLASIKNIRNLLGFSYTLASEGLTFGVQFDKRPFCKRTFVWACFLNHMLFKKFDIDKLINKRDWSELSVELR